MRWPSCSCRRGHAAPHQRGVRADARVIEKQEGFDGMMQVAGFSFVGQGENVGMVFVKLKDWSERKITASDFIQKANMRCPGSATRRSSC